MLDEDALYPGEENTSNVVPSPPIAVGLHLGHKTSRMFVLDGRTGALAHEVQSPQADAKDSTCPSDAHIIFVGRNGVQ